MDIYVGNLAFEMNDGELETAFQEFGQVDSARVITDRDSGRSRGFGFVEMPNQGEGQAAIDALNGKELKGRSVVVNEARPRDRGGDRGGRSGGGGGGGGGRRW